MADPSSAEASPDASAGDGHLSWARLLTWASEECGATGLDSIQLGTFEHGGELHRGLAASRDIAEGEYFLCMPEKCWWYEKTAFVNPVQVAGELCLAEERAILALAEAARKVDPAHAPHLEMLPDENHFRESHPSMHRADMEAFLPEAMHYWSHWTESLHACWEEEYSPALGTEAAPWSDVYFSGVRYYSRRFQECGMVPIVELCNTGPEGALTVTARYDEAGSFCIEALRDISKGEELLVNYGYSSLSPFEAFMVYGFAFPPEHHSSLSIHEARFCEDFLLDIVKEPFEAQHRVLQAFWTWANVHCTEEAIIAAEVAAAQSEEEHEQDDKDDVESDSEEQDESDRGENGYDGSGSSESGSEASACSGAAAGVDGACPASPSAADDWDGLAEPTDVASAAGPGPAALSPASAGPGVDGAPPASPSAADDWDGLAEPVEVASAAGPGPAALSPPGAGPRSAAAGLLGVAGGAPWLLPLGLAALCCLTSGSIFRARPSGAASGRRRARS